MFRFLFIFFFLLALIGASRGQQQQTPKQVRDAIQSSVNYVIAENAKNSADIVNNLNQIPVLAFELQAKADTVAMLRYEIAKLKAPKKEEKK